MNFKDLLSPKKWLEGVVVKSVAGKFAKHGTGALIGLLTGPWFAAKVAPVLSQLGVGIDYTKFEEGATVLLIGGFGALWNLIQQRISK